MKTLEINYISKILIYIYHFNITRYKYDKEREVCKAVYRYDECTVMRGAAPNTDTYNAQVLSLKSAAMFTYKQRITYKLKDFLKRTACRTTSYNTVLD